MGRFCPAPAIVTSFVNTTQVPNYNTTVGGTIAPYERWSDTSESGGCDNNSNCPAATNGIPCGSWIGTELTPAIESYTMVAGYTNTAPQNFTAGPNINFAVCNKRGFKNVGARRQWHGTFGYTSEAKGSNLTTCAGSGCNWSVSTFGAYAPSPDQTKYLTLTWSGPVTYVETNYPASVAGYTQVQGSITGAVTVNSQSGEVTSTLETFETDTNTLGGISPVTTKNVAGGYDSVTSTYGNATIMDGMTGDFSNAGSDGTPGIPGGGSLLSTIQSWNSTFCTVPGFTTFPAITDMNSYSGSAAGTVDNGVVTVHTTSAISWTRTNNQMTWSYSYSSWGTDDSTGTLSSDVPQRYVTYSGTATLSNQNTNVNMQTDVTTLLSYWPLNNDSLYPWRTDGYTNIMPKMSRLEPNYNSSPLQFIPYTTNDYTSPINDSSGHTPFSSGWTGTWNQRAWFDPAIWYWQFPAGHDQTTAAALGLVQMFDGSIQGAPNPAGYQGYFRFDYQDWRGCCEGDDQYLWYLYGVGGSLPNYLPQNATQWTNFYEVINKPILGALLAYADTQTVPAAPDCEANNVVADGAFWAVKWAEIGETYQSINFARPAGADKFALDETEVYCFVSQAGSLVTLNNYDGTSPSSLPFTTSDIVGGAAVGGFYAVSSVSANTVTLGAKQFNVPSTWSLPSGDAATAIGRLRWPTAPSLLGRVGITPNGAGTTMTFATAQPTFGMAATAHEQVDIYDGTMTLLASNITATRTSDTTFTVTTAYTTAAWVMIHGSPAWTVNTNAPKGDYVYLEWLLDNRTNGENTRMAGQTDCSGHTPPTTQPATNNGYASFSQTQDNLPFVTCAQRVACFSPNAETWTNGKTYGFPTFQLDELYGSKWQGQILWSITDPFWQTPHAPCGVIGTGSLSWVMDNGSCEVNTTDPDTGNVTAYYGMAPMVEARLTVPTGDPALPAGITLGFLSPVTYTVGDVAYPPTPPGYIANGAPNYSIQVPWILQGVLCASVAGSCRFNYGQWVMGC